MRRRDFIKVIAGSAVAWPLAVRAQPPATPIVGFLSAVVTASTQHFIVAFREGLAASGFVEGQNIAIAYHLPPDKRQIQSDIRSHFIHRPRGTSFHRSAKLEFSQIAFKVK
jgi:putative ABC transport system substrate-binding protein